jgi:hypothetical protein
MDVAAMIVVAVIVLLTGTAVVGLSSGSHKGRTRRQDVAGAYWRPSPEQMGR